MANFLRHLSMFLGLLLLLTAFLISPICGLTCTSQSFTSNNVRYTNCTDLPSLDSFLHWSYDQTNATLSVAFIAPPAKSGGWVAWAINPTATGMAGSQALLAHRDSNGSTVVKTYNISAYNSVVESRLSFDVLEKTAEYSNGTIKIFAKLALPENMTTLNQVWQVGPSVKNGIPDVHEFKKNNLDAKGTLKLVGGAGNDSSSSGGAAASTPSPSVSPRPSAGSGGGGQSSSEKLLNRGIFGLSVLLCSTLALVF